MAIIFKPHRRASGSPGPPAPPFDPTSAVNGLSVDPVSGAIVWGQDIGAPGDPAQLLSNREIPMSGFSFAMLDAGIRNFLIDPVSSLYAIGDVDSVGNGFVLYLDSANQDYFLGDFNFIEPVVEVRGSNGGLTNPVIDAFVPDQIGGFVDFQIFNNPAQHATLQMSSGITGNTYEIFLTADDVLGDYYSIQSIPGGPVRKKLFIDFLNEIYQFGDINAEQNGTFMEVDDTNNKFLFSNLAATSVINMNGVDGFTGTVAPVNSITVNGGIVTAVS